jgi:hypothetical protein
LQARSSQVAYINGYTVWKCVGTVHKYPSVVRECRVCGCYIIRYLKCVDVLISRSDEKQAIPLVHSTLAHHTVLHCIEVYQYALLNADNDGVYYV